MIKSVQFTPFFMRAHAENTGQIFMLQSVWNRPLMKHFALGTINLPANDNCEDKRA